MESRTKNLGLDFLVGSIHFIDAFAFDHKPELWKGIEIDELYRRFFELSIQLASCGVFDGLAHPDSLKLFGHLPSCSLEPYYKRLAAALAQADVCRAKQWNFPQAWSAAGMEPPLLQEMKRIGVRIQTASDAHHPSEVGLGIQEAEALVLQASKP